MDANGKSRDYLQGAWDAVSLVHGVLTSWGEIQTQLLLEDLSTKLLHAMEDGFMEAFELEYPGQEPRPYDFVLSPATVGVRDGKHVSDAQR